MSVDQSVSSVLRVLLTGDDPTDAAADRVLADVNRLWNRDFSGTTVATADYTVGQLKGWFDTVAADFHELMTGVDLDEGGNRITVMVADLDADQDTVAEYVAGLGVPAEAVVVREDRLLLPDPAPEPQVGIGLHTGLPQGLQTGLDPFVGGGEIYSWDGSAGDSRTLGFPIAFINAEGRYEQGFITAGHCDRGDPFFGYGYAGHAIYVAYLGDTQRSAYSSGVDALYAKKTGTLPPLGVGLIARVRQETHRAGNASRYELLLDADDPHFQITSTRSPFLGETVHKIGRTSGWTSGSVTVTCQVFIDNDTGQRFDCAADAAMGIEPGDSGAPVFAIESDGTVALVGLAIHKTKAPQGARYMLAHRVLSELFYLQGIPSGNVWLTSDPPPILTNIDITRTPISGDTYQPGETIEFTYTFSEDVTLYPVLPPRVVLAAPGPRYPTPALTTIRNDPSGPAKTNWYSLGKYPTTCRAGSGTRPKCRATARPSAT